MESVGDRVRRIREQMGLTQTELSKKADMGGIHTPISRIETGISKRPSRKSLNAISKVLGVSVDYLRYGDDFDINNLPQDVKKWLSSRKNVEWLMKEVINKLPVDGDLPNEGLSYETKTIPFERFEELNK